MKITFDTKSAKSDALVLFVTDGGGLLETGKKTDKKTKSALKRAIKAEKFQGKKAQSLVVSGPAGTSHDVIVLMGVGKQRELTLKCFEKIGSALCGVLNAHKAATAEVIFETGSTFKDFSEAEAASRMATGLVLNSYRFDKYLTRQAKDKKPTLRAAAFKVAEPAPARKIFADEQKVAGGVFLTRDLVSEPPNVLYPESFADIIRKELTPLGIEVKVLHAKDIQKMGMGALMAVGQGSAREPKLVSMEYKGGDKKQKPVAFVGKGVTFDTGGISLKPGPGMEEMKWDMGGAGVVTGLMKALAARQARVNAVGVVALAENMPSGTACRPGDIVTSLSGQTVEILNTDAEGRLILCDALWYTQEKFHPTHIVDLATLTGAVIIALGHEYAGLFSNDDDFADTLIKSSRNIGEELWHMPLNDAWDKALDSPAADVKNIAGSREAGSATAAHFLKRFIKSGVKWAHLDIAGVAWTNKDRTSAPKGATGFGVRLLDDYVRGIETE
ncbi:MAG: leucyl aminopeptidase [Alphaproteobacteria bacterium]|nr:leucyl aminopeptidase [Alphaproteobacteria bacterium]